jgi:1-acyl-sn-glycerol-3-phosphate acyltransferase
MSLLAGRTSADAKAKTATSPPPGLGGRASRMSVGSELRVRRVPPSKARTQWFYLTIRMTYIWAVPLTFYYRTLVRLWRRLGWLRLPWHARFLRLQVPRCVGRAILSANGVRLRVRGLENLESLTGPAVIFVNHNSRMDAYILLATLPFEFRTFYSNEAHLVKDELRTLVWIGRSLDLFFFHDKSNKRATVSEFVHAKEYVQAGGILSVFPEGGMHQDRTAPMADFGVGCMALAIASQAKVVPITMANTEYTFERRRTDAARTVALSCGEPVSTAGHKRTEAAALTQALREKMVREYQALLGGG